MSQLKCFGMLVACMFVISAQAEPKWPLPKDVKTITLSYTFFEIDGNRQAVNGSTGT